MVNWGRRYRVFAIGLVGSGLCLFLARVVSVFVVGFVFLVFIFWLIRFCSFFPLL